MDIFFSAIRRGDLGEVVETIDNYYFQETTGEPNNVHDIVHYGLFEAVKCGNLSMVRLMLEYGGDPHFHHDVSTNHYM